MAYDNFVFNEYKPLRNHLIKLSLDDSFLVIWSYIQHLQFNNSIPKEIEVILEFLNKDHIQKIRMCSEWELETLTREIIINGQESFFNNQTLKKWSYFAGAVNKLKNLENSIGGNYVNKDNILVELFRISHRQFPWQTRPNSEFLTRYYKIFSTPKLDEILQKSIGLTAKNLYIVGMMFIGAYLKHPAVNLPIKIEIKGLNQENIEKFLKVFSASVNELKEKIKKEQELNNKFVYSFSSLRAFPIIKMIYFGQECLVCPLPTLLFWRITNGIYYEICNEKSFDNYFGTSFQNYTGEVIKKATIANGKINFLPEEQYFVGKDRKDTVDWIVYDDNSALFVECKTKRLKLPAKFELDDSSYVNDELEKMADFILQIYKTIRDYKDNKYLSFKFDENKKVFPLVLTLEQWYLFGDRFLDELDKILVEKLKQEKIDLSYLERMPYSICSIDEFEKIIQIIQKTGISDFMQNKVFDDNKKKWAFQPFMSSEFTKHYKDAKFLFEEDYQGIFNSILKNNS
jgi:hypothetical protein